MLILLEREPKVIPITLHATHVPSAPAQNHISYANFLATWKCP